MNTTKNNDRSTIYFQSGSARTYKGCITELTGVLSASDVKSLLSELQALKKLDQNKGLQTQKRGVLSCACCCTDAPGVQIVKRIYPRRYLSQGRPE